ncbi:MAG: COX15/CtaA family protein [Candidatus Methylomirabilaceae bacterium]
MRDHGYASRPIRGTDTVWLHRLAVLTSTLTLVLILAGGLVTSTGSALAVPDWPTTFGYNMFFYPWSEMKGGILYEHSHRLIGSVVGLLTVILALWLWVKEPRGWVRWLGVAAAAAVVVQGVLGGVRVMLASSGQTLAILHGCLAQAFFALLVSLAIFTSREWKQDPLRPSMDRADRLGRLCLLTTGFVFLQVVLGAMLTHAGILLTAHLLCAALIAIHVSLLEARILRHRIDLPELAFPSSLLCGLLALQLLLGLGSYLGRFTSIGISSAALSGPLLPVAHRVTAALMLATCLVLTLRSYRLSGSARTAVGHTVASEGARA